MQAASGALHAAVRYSVRYCGQSGPRRTHGAPRRRHHAQVMPRSISVLLPLLASAFAALPAQAQSLPCRIDPFGAETAADRATVLSSGCSGQQVDYGLQALRARPTDPGPSRVAAHIDAIASQPLGKALLGTLRLNWSAAGSEGSDRLLRTERTAWAAGTWWHLAPAWAVQMNVGREFAGVRRTRATLAGVWQPWRNGTLFAEWAGNGDRTDGQRVGLRWWLAHQRLALEAGTQRGADTGWVDPHLRLHWSLLPG